MECTALYAVAAGSHIPGILSSAVQLLGSLAVVNGCPATQQAAVRGLTDLALLFGPAAVDSILRRPGAATAAETKAADGALDDDAGDGIHNQVVAKGLLELLIEQGEILLAEAQAPAGKAKRGPRYAFDASIRSGCMQAPHSIICIGVCTHKALSDMLLCIQKTFQDVLHATLLSNHG